MESDVPSYLPPKSESKDIAYTLVKAAVASIPVVGGAAAEIFQVVITPPLDRRRNAWMERIGNSLLILEQRKVIDLEELQNNKIFASVLVQASQAAIRNHNEEKLKALQNAILNSAQGISIVEDFQVMFVRFIDE